MCLWFTLVAICRYFEGSLLLALFTRDLIVENTLLLSFLWLYFGVVAEIIVFRRRHSSKFRFLVLSNTILTDVTGASILFWSVECKHLDQSRIWDNSGGNHSFWRILLLSSLVSIQAENFWRRFARLDESLSSEKLLSDCAMLLHRKSPRIQDECNFNLCFRRAHHRW